MGIGYILDELLKYKNINVNELARRTSISPSTLYSITPCVRIVVVGK